jgi:NAD(P)H-flavin reductase
MYGVRTRRVHLRALHNIVVVLSSPRPELNVTTHPMSSSPQPSTPAVCPQPVRVVSNVPESPLVHRVRVDVSGHPLVESLRTAGQYVVLGAADTEPRYFAVASTVADLPFADFLIGRGSPTSDALCNLAPGEEVFVSEAMGKGFGEPAEGPLVLFGSGTGVAALRPVIRAALQGGGLRRPIALFQSRSQGHFVELERECEEWRHQGVTVVVTDGGPGQWVHELFDAWAERPSLETCHFLLCGSTRLVESVTDYLRQHHVPDGHVHFNY